MFSDCSSMKFAEKKSCQSYFTLFNLQKLVNYRNYFFNNTERSRLLPPPGPDSIYYLRYLIRYLEGWSSATKFNLLKNCVDISLGNSGRFIWRPGQHEYSPAGFTAISSQLYHQPHRVLRTSLCFQSCPSH